MRIDKSSSLNNSNINVKKSSLEKQFNDFSFQTLKFKSEDQIILSKNAKKFVSFSKNLNSPEEKFGFGYLYKNLLMNRVDSNEFLSSNNESISGISNSIFEIWKNGISDNVLNIYTSKTISLMDNDKQMANNYIDAISSLKTLPKSQLEANIVTISKKIS